MRPSEVDILAIDAEGLDVQILTLFLKFLGCEQHAHLLIHVSNHPHILGGSRHFDYRVIPDVQLR